MKLSLIECLNFLVNQFLIPLFSSFFENIMTFPPVAVLVYFLVAIVVILGIFRVFS